VRYIDNSAAYKNYIDHFNDRLAGYIPPRKQWTPAEQALFAPDDLYDLPREEALSMQFAAIHHAFSRHYELNPMYRNFCESNSVSPGDINSTADLFKIPLIPDAFFKNYPTGKPFATWLGNLVTGNLPQIRIRQNNPSLDQVIDSFNRSGMCVTYSSGTGGRHTIIPRDPATFDASQYALAKCMLAMSCGRWIDRSDACLLMPDPRENYLHAGKALRVIFDIVGHVQVAIKSRISISVMGAVMNNGSGLKARTVRFVSAHRSRQMIRQVIDWLEERRHAPDFTFILGAPYLIYHVLMQLKKENRAFSFGERGGVVTGGGWKIHEHERLPADRFRELVEQVLGIPPRYCLDIYGMVEGNGWMIQCPEGHYLHVPWSYFMPMVLDEKLQPVPGGEWGRFAFLDASASSYPGFILTGDRARLLDKCPVCSRPGPVLDPEISRLAGQAGRGCGEEVRRMFAVNQPE